MLGLTTLGILAKNKPVGNFFVLAFIVSTICSMVIVVDKMLGEPWCIYANFQWGSVLPAYALRRIRYVEDYWYYHFYLTALMGAPIVLGVLAFPFAGDYPKVSRAWIIGMGAIVSMLIVIYLVSYVLTMLQ